MKQSRILVANDNPAICSRLRDYFQQHGLLAECTSTPRGCLWALDKGDISLIILNARLGEGDGFGLLREIRARSDVPIIVVTTHEGDETDRVGGLEAGADDYVAEPFSLRELLARVGAVLRRHEIARARLIREPKDGGFTFQGWALYRRDRRLIDPSGKPVPLTKGEYALLLAFLSSPHVVLSRDQLVQATRVHGDLFDKSIDVKVLRLRRKLECAPTKGHLIQTKRGLGYAFVADVKELQSTFATPTTLRSAKK
ncbi:MULTISPECIES: response regulator transcription factor [Rhodomicrobium]|uniref:response regulator transcription factor n=1 Tax=Rhodomicrobium TaxID=1068 RepID=UPI000B4C184C|nr:MULTISPECIES: response regulator transcription factor [Rhodomicrobium]